MAKSRKLETLLDTLQQLRKDLAAEDQFGSTAPERTAQLRQILQSSYAVAIAQAARLIGEIQQPDLEADLVAAFQRFLVNPTETDPNCHAKGAIADALYRMESHAESVFLQGIRHVQMEPVWGGRVDTAAKLRGTCALGLVRMHSAHGMTELGDLLADPEIPARIAAAQAIAYSENPAGIPLLRLRVRVGDEPSVSSECLAALLKLDPDASLSFAAGFLNDPNPQMQELTALVLGESRLPAAFEWLKTWWERTHTAELRQVGLLAIALLRHNAALQFLVTLVQEGKPEDAQAALAALRSYQGQAPLWEQVEAAIAQRSDALPLE